METFLLVVILIVLFVRWIILSGKLSKDGGVASTTYPETALIRN